MIQVKIQPSPKFIKLESLEFGLGTLDANSYEPDERRFALKDKIPPCA